MADLFVLFLLFLTGWFWLDAMRAHELATALAGRACKAHDLQLLDQAMALRRVGLHWGREGLRLRRSYRFEFSDGGLDRQPGELILVGLRLELLTLNRNLDQTARPAVAVTPPPGRQLPDYPVALGWIGSAKRPDPREVPGEERGDERLH